MSMWFVTIFRSLVRGVYCMFPWKRAGWRSEKWWLRDSQGGLWISMEVYSTILNEDRQNCSEKDTRVVPKDPERSLFYRWICFCTNRYSKKLSFPNVFLDQSLEKISTEASRSPPLASIANNFNQSLVRVRTLTRASIGKIIFCKYLLIMVQTRWNIFNFPLGYYLFLVWSVRVFITKVFSAGLTRSLGSFPLPFVLIKILNRDKKKNDEYLKVYV